MEMVARIYAANESYDAAIGPLARALQLDPTRRSLWSALDNAVKMSGRATITDVELARRAAEFRAAASGRQ
jgi:cytochrome c-type biogenesis protein CcmH/NrfG